MGLPPSCLTTSTTSDQGGGTGISNVHPDIISTHILSRLDGPSLAAASCTSSDMHSICTEEHLWKDICSSTWPSTSDPRVRDLISTFPFGYRSFFYDSFPLFTNPTKPITNCPCPSPASKLISAVDIYYNNKNIFSRVQEMETLSSWFRCSPFRVDLLDEKELIRTSIYQAGEPEEWVQNLEKNLKLSWILMDPGHTRSTNLSSWSPVSVQRHWLTGDVQVRYASILAVDGRDQSQLVQCGVVVTCGGIEGEEMHVREVSMMLEDMDGKNLKGADSLAILQRGMERGERRVGKGEEGRRRYEKFLELKRERRERKQRRERRLDLICITVVICSFMAVLRHLF